MKSIGRRLVVVESLNQDTGGEVGVVGVLVEGAPEVSAMSRGASPNGSNPPEAVKALARAGASIRLVSGAHLWAQ